jgi:transcriptional regulator with XRE-family HTH domain
MRDKTQLRIDFGKNVRETREKLGLSQEALADKAGMHRTYIGTIERAEQSITIDVISRLAEALEIESALLMKAR